MGREVRDLLLGRAIPAFLNGSHAGFEGRYASHRDRLVCLSSDAALVVTPGGCDLRAGIPLHRTPTMAAVARGV
jgi:hypothetical protein